VVAGTSDADYPGDSNDAFTITFNVSIRCTSVGLTKRSTRFHVYVDLS